MKKLLVIESCEKCPYREKDSGMGYCGSSETCGKGNFLLYDEDSYGDTNKWYFDKTLKIHPNCPLTDATFDAARSILPPDICYPRVGTGVIVTDDKQPNKVLLGLRKGSHGEGEWSLPGGHLDYGENWEECAKREVEEETGLKIDTVEFTRHVTNDLFPKDKKHYATIFLRADAIGGELEVKEKDFCEEWRWVDRRDLGGYKLFPPLDQLLGQTGIFIV